MPGTVAPEGPTVSLSFANNFWGRDDAGVGPLLDRMHAAKITGDELKTFYATRAQIEEDYARKLLNLARKPLGSLEIGTLRMSLDVVRGEVESMGKQHQAIASQMKSELDEPLAAFNGSLKERRKIVQNGIEKLLKTKNQQTATVNKARDRFEQDCLKIKGYLAQGHMVMGQEERKNKAKLEKTQIQMSSNSSEYEAAVKVLEETTGRWNREWKGACDKFQDLEEERLDYFKSSLWTLANITSTVCVSDDASCEKIRLSLEDCEVEKDITQFIKDFGTGQEIPDPPKYINFCRGDVEDAASLHESEDGNYSVAQFPRPINPTFRTSSPQPSTLESHHDPDSSLREEMGLPKTRTSLQTDAAFNARGSQTVAAPPQPLAMSQTAPSTNTYANIPKVPQNPYTLEGLTQPVIGPPSERSSNQSPTRPGSRDSIDHSDYSQPTSVSSYEVMTGQTSPLKQYNGSNVSAPQYNGSDMSSLRYNGSNVSAPQFNGSSVSAPQQMSSTMSGAPSNTSNVSAGPTPNDERTIQKKKSGFFQSHSPFRRRSQKGREQPVSASATATPAGGNSRTPSANRMSASANTSPIKPLNAGTRANTWQARQITDLNVVDPRAEGYQLGVGNNVFDVALPDAKNKAVSSSRQTSFDLDPIAQALAELKGVAKQATVRQSADRHYGMATPAPDGRGTPAGAVPTPFANTGARNTPPPAYNPPVSRLGAPQPAHTSREMQKTTERFINQKRDMFNRGNPSRPASVMAGGQEQARAPSPAPRRAPSPQPSVQGDRRQQQPYRSPSPNPYGSQAASRPHQQSTSPAKPQQNVQSNFSGYNSRGGSPGYQAPRAASPNPAYSRPAAGNGRPGSAMASDHGNSTALQLAPVPSQSTYDDYARSSRPQSQFYPEEGSYGASQLGSRNRSQSVGAQRQFTKAGAPILHYSRAMYMYQASIPEELSFAKGDILAVTRHQDDGWWEAEVVGKNGHPGLVPSNYLKPC